MRSSTSVHTVETQLDGSTTRDTLSNYDLEIDMLASRAFERDGNNEHFITSPTITRPPRVIIDDYLEDVSLSSSDSDRNTHTPSQKRGSSSIDDHYEFVVVPQLEIILDAVRAVQYEVNHLHNEVLDMKTNTRYALKKIWEYLNYSVDDMTPE